MCVCVPRQRSPHLASLPGPTGSTLPHAAFYPIILAEEPAMGMYPHTRTTTLPLYLQLVPYSLCLCTSVP